MLPLWFHYGHGYLSVWHSGHNITESEFHSIFHYICQACYFSQCLSLLSLVSFPLRQSRRRSSPSSLSFSSRAAAISHPRWPLKIGYSQNLTFYTAHRRKFRPYITLKGWIMNHVFRMTQWLTCYRHVKAMTDNLQERRGEMSHVVCACMYVERTGIERTCQLWTDCSSFNYSIAAETMNSFRGKFRYRIRPQSSVAN